MGDICTSVISPTNPTAVCYSRQLQDLVSPQERRVNKVMLLPKNTHNTLEINPPQSSCTTTDYISYLYHDNECIHELEHWPGLHQFYSFLFPK